jgi:hypothetical protein
MKSVVGFLKPQSYGARRRAGNIDKRRIDTNNNPG